MADSKRSPSPIHLGMIRWSLIGLMFAMTSAPMAKIVGCQDLVVPGSDGVVIHFSPSGAIEGQALTVTVGNVHYNPHVSPQVEVHGNIITVTLAADAITISFGRPPICSTASLGPLVPGVYTVNLIVIDQVVHGGVPFLMGTTTLNVEPANPDDPCVYGQVLAEDGPMLAQGASLSALVALTRGDLATCAPPFSSTVPWITFGGSVVIDRPPDAFIYHGYSATIVVAANTGPARQGSFQLATYPVDISQPGAEQPDYRTLVKEYYHARWDHYFMTPDPNEVALLGKPPFEDWQATGRSFVAYTNFPPGIHSPIDGPETAVCRFFNDSFAPKSTHFYGLPDVCDQVSEFFPGWQLESQSAFRMGAPNGDGTCPASTPVPVYRLYNNGSGGAPNHRFVASLEDRAAMLSQGWIAEGFGPLGLGFCGPRGE